MTFQFCLAGEKGQNIAQPEVLLDEGEVRLVVNAPCYLCVKLRLKLSILPVSEKVLECLSVPGHWLKYGNM